MFVNPLVDYLFIGGGITLPIFALIYLLPSLTPVSGDIPVRTFIAINAAHFAASTVRLYTKPGARQEFPFLSWVFPLLCFALVGLGLYWPRAGGHIKALYFTWSPFHYAAQTYGLAVMYAMRSGARLDREEKRQIWLVCLLPFVYSFFTTQMGGLFWFVSLDTLLAHPISAAAYRTIVAVLVAAVLLVPISLFWQMRRMGRTRVPLISLLLQITNGVWWIGSDYLNAWFWTAILHSVQYLIIVTIRHVDDHVVHAAGERRLRPVLLHGTAFYGFSLAVGYVLFFIAPSVYAAFGFSGVESYAMMTMVINLHHFVVDGFIWRAPRASQVQDARSIEPALAEVVGI
ncbi:MAG TPA: hypothetical protein VF491_06745 [Vicinamibacterales bacterium]